MMKSTIVTVLISLFFYFTNGQNINAMVAYKNKVYAFDGLDWLEDGTGFVAHAYELTNGKQTNKFTLPITNQGAIQLSSFVHGNTLYQISGAYGEATLSTYKLPLTSPVHATATVELPNQVQEISAIISFEDGFAFVLCSRYLTVIDLSTMTVSSSILAISGSKKTPGSLVYNSNTNKLYYFQTNYCFAGFCQHIYVYDVSSIGVLSVAPESDTFAPDYTTSFNSGELSGCSLTPSSSIIWCMNHGTNQLVEISTTDFSNHTILSTPSGVLSKGQVAFDFTSSHVYLSSAHPNDATTFSVYEMDLEGTVIGELPVKANPSATLSLISSSSLLIGNTYGSAAQATQVTIAGDHMKAKVINFL